MRWRSLDCLLNEVSVGLEGWMVLWLRVLTAHPENQSQVTHNYLSPALRGSEAVDPLGHSHTSVPTLIQTQTDRQTYPHH